MNDLDPALKKLIQVARRAPAQTETLSEFFAAKLVKRWQPGAPESDWLIWQRLVWGSAWAAAAVILLGLALFFEQNLRHASFYDVTPAYQVVSTELVP